MVNIPDNLIELEYRRLKERYKMMNEQEQHIECIKAEASMYEIEFLLNSCQGVEGVWNLLQKLRKMEIE